MDKNKVNMIKQVNLNMSHVRSSGSKIESVLASEMWKAGFRYRKQYKIMGKPDFVLVKYKIAIFCDSSFWHGYKNMRTARHNFKSNIDFWYNKINRNIIRDKQVNRHLKKEDWIVLRFWDFQILKNVDKCIQKIKKAKEKK